MWSRCDVADEPVGRGHERPGLAAQVEAQLHLGHPPVGLHRRPRVALDGQALVLERTDRRIVHRDDRAIPPTIQIPSTNEISSERIQESRVKSQDSRFEIQDSRCQIQDSRCRVRTCRMPDSGYHVSAIESLASGIWHLASGIYILEWLMMDCRVVTARGRSRRPTASCHGLGRCGRTRRTPGTAAGSPAGFHGGGGATTAAATRTPPGC